MDITDPLGVLAGWQPDNGNYNWECLDAILKWTFYTTVHITILCPIWKLDTASANKPKAVQSSTGLYSTTDVTERYLLMQRFTETHSAVHLHQQSSWELRQLHCTGCTDSSVHAYVYLSQTLHSLHSTR